MQVDGVTEVSSAVVPASHHDFAARVRHSPMLDLAQLPAAPAAMPMGPEAFAQRDLRKLDAEMHAEAERALAEIAALDPETRKRDLGPVEARLADVPALLARRQALRALSTRLQALLVYTQRQQQVADHDTILMLEAVGQAMSFFARFDTSMAERYTATLALLGQRGKKVSVGIAAARRTEPTR